MSGSQDTSARLRKAFKYPSENDSSDPGSDLDEQEQEALIQNLAKADAQKTQNYKTAFISLPLLSIILYIPKFLLPSSNDELLLAVLAITSFLSTAYILWFIPLPGEKQGPKTVSIPGIGVVDAGAPGPVQQYLGYLNLGLCTILALMGERGEHRDKPDELVWWMLPASMFPPFQL
jgi:hypothetical protein